MPPTTSGALASGSRLMGLKFMQRRQAQQQPSPAQPSQQQAVQGPTAGAGQQPSPAAAGAGTPTAPVLPSSAAEWTLDTGDSAPAGRRPSEKLRLRVVHDDDGAPASDDVSALLSFRAGRRSFGKFNPRLEKRLADIGTNQRAAEEERARAARDEDERQRQQEEHAELLARAEAQQALERANAVSDAEMAGHFASRYGKYVPRPELQQPPVVDHPVHVSDAPSGRGAKRSMPSSERLRPLNGGGDAHASGAPKKHRAH